MRFLSKTVRCSLACASLFLAPSAFAKVWMVPASDHLEFDAQEAILQAAPGDTVQLPEGRFNLQGELTIATPYLTLQGAGMDKTVLVYGEDAYGPQSIYSSVDHTTVQDLTILDHPGDGVKIIGTDGPIIRRVKVEWTNHGSPDNGAYGIYPVQSQNVLVEDNVVIGASDSGVYVGQSHNIIVRNNRVEFNVAGIEIENSQHADVLNNFVTNNTGGVLVFNLPNLLVQGGAGTRIFDNVIFDNNFKNFAPPGNSVSTTPQGTGVLVLGNDDVEIFENTIEKHNTTSIAIVNYHITEREVDDPNYDAMPETIYIHDNILRQTGLNPFQGGNQLGMVAALLSVPHKIPHITYDGIGPLDAKGNATEAKLEGDKRLCIGPNDHDGDDTEYFGNLNLWTKKWYSPIPGSMNHDITSHNCTLPRHTAIVLPEVPPAPALTNVHTPEEIAALCAPIPSGVNWSAFAVDCPTLDSYGLFKNPADPLSGSNEGGFPYDLTTPLFSDYATKDRHIFLPPGVKAGYTKVGALDLPVGAVLAKTFYFPANITQPNGDRKLVETRLLVHRAEGWQGLVYVWDDSGVAKLMRGGEKVDVSWVDANGQARSNGYRVPNLAQCVGCHLKGAPIGVKTPYLNKNGHGEFEGQNQLTALAAKGMLEGLPQDLTSVPKYPVWNDPSTGSLDERARAYLDINCAHCHSVTGKASTSGLFLSEGSRETINFGICKPPIAAGRGSGGTLFDIFPGKPEESILIGRLSSTKAAVKMPELAKGMVHDEGVALISEWIKSLSGTCKVGDL